MSGKCKKSVLLLLIILLIVSVFSVSLLLTIASPGASQYNPWDRQSSISLSKESIIPLARPFPSAAEFFLRVISNPSVLAGTSVLAFIEAIISVGFIADVIAYLYILQIKTALLLRDRASHEPPIFFAL